MILCYCEKCKKNDRTDAFMEILFEDFRETTTFVIW